MNGTAPPPGTPPVPPPSVSGGRPPMSAAGKIGVALAALLLLAVLYWLGSASGSSAKNEDGVGASAGAAGTIRRIEPLPPPPPEPIPVAMTAPAAAPAPRPVEIAPRPRGPRQTIRPAPVMGYEAQGGAREDAAMPAAATGEGGAEDALAARLQATRTDTAKARRLRDPDLTITMGTIIPCTPQQPLNTQLEGFLSCVVPVEVRGTTGRVVLLDRGTRIVGQIKSGMRHGQNRAFVLWTRAETPDGVIIQLSSPGTDALGQNGLDVDVETNFWSRFGGASCCPSSTRACRRRRSARAGWSTRAARAAISASTSCKPAAGVLPLRRWTRRSIFRLTALGRRGSRRLSSWPEI